MPQGSHKSFFNVLALEQNLSTRAFLPSHCRQVPGRPLATLGKFLSASLPEWRYHASSSRLYRYALKVSCCTRLPDTSQPTLEIPSPRSSKDRMTRFFIEFYPIFPQIRKDSKGLLKPLPGQPVKVLYDQCMIAIRPGTDRRKKFSEFTPVELNRRTASV